MEFKFCVMLVSFLLHTFAYDILFFRVSILMYQHARYQHPIMLGLHT